MPSTIATTFSRRAGAAAAAAVFLAGCRQDVDLSAIRTLATDAEAAAPSFAALADDYRASCLRRAELHSIASAVRVSLEPRARRPAAHAYPRAATPFALGAMAAASVEALPAETLAAFDASQALAIVERPDIVAIEAALRPDQRAALLGAVAEAGERGDVASCASAAGVAVQWRRRDDLLVAYFAALGSLAGAPRSATDDRYGMRGLAASLRAGGVFDAAATDRLGTLATNALGAGFDARRRDALADDLVRGAPLVAELTAGLAQVAGTNYVFELREERDALDEFRAENLRAAKPGTDAFAAYAYAKSLQADDAALDARESAAAAYVAALGRLETASATISAAVERRDLASTFAAARLLHDDLRGDLGVLDRAFPDTSKGSP